MSDENPKTDGEVTLDPIVSWGHPDELLLCEAAKRADLKQISRHIGNAVNLNFSDGFGRTPLHYACQNGSFEAVKLLVANGAVVNLMDANHTTPLHLAARANHKVIVKFLLLRNADFNVECVSGCKPVDFAPYGTETWRVLIDAANGKLPNVEDLIQTRTISLVPQFAIQREVDKKATKSAKKGKKGGKKGGKKSGKKKKK
ncbi:Protein phosphatase 1 regulatory inhibitor subunit 16B [Paragonimus heterotremus]|uniref:Protein phosphatase 1 regulatory inhibitor subunit 16B n=1 Tax=Paragonimus heterotremus TaxID=100268 RepID=A0A8J4T1B9_9TREM|nr:Protein phosphatase 1 regulatory inhibitor subunit 16B [Paragonimus heterotremus]